MSENNFASTSKTISNEGVVNPTPTAVDSMVIKQDIYPDTGIITKRNFNQYGQVEAVQILNETHTVMRNTIILNQLPSTYYRVQIDGMTESIGNQNKITPNEFVVGYEAGKIYFNPCMEGKEVTISQYYGIGVELIPTSRIYMATDTKGNVTNTLYDMIQVGTNAMTALQEVGGVLADGKATAQKLETDTSNANDIDNTLTQTTIPLANSTNNTLNSTINQGTNLNNTLTQTNNTLKNTNSEANNSNTTLTNTINNANIIESALTASIGAGQNLDSTLTNDINTGNTLHTTLQSDINTANNSISGLENSTSTANTSNNTLKETIKSAETIKSTLSKVNDNGNYINNNLIANIDIAKNNIKKIERDCSTATQLYNNLTNDINTGNTLHTTLQSDINTANNSNTTLTRAIVEAKTANNSLKNHIAQIEGVTQNALTSSSSPNLTGNWSFENGALLSFLDDNQNNLVNFVSNASTLSMTNGYDNNLPIWNYTPKNGSNINPFDFQVPLQVKDVSSNQSTTIKGNNILMNGQEVIYIDNNNNLILGNNNLNSLTVNPYTLVNNSVNIGGSLLASSTEGSIPINLNNGQIQINNLTAIDGSTNAKTLTLNTGGVFSNGVEVNSNLNVTGSVNIQNITNGIEFKGASIFYLDSNKNIWINTASTMSDGTYFGNTYVNGNICASTSTTNESGFVLNNNNVLTASNNNLNINQSKGYSNINVYGNLTVNSDTVFKGDNLCLSNGSTHGYFKNDGNGNVSIYNDYPATTLQLNTDNQLHYINGAGDGIVLTNLNYSGYAPSIVSIKDSNQIQSNDDFNNYMTTGVYYSGSSAVISTVKNSPTSNACCIEILCCGYSANNSTNGFVYQRIIDMNSGVWFRAYYAYNGTWSNWVSSGANVGNGNLAIALKPNGSPYGSELLAINNNIAMLKNNQSEQLIQSKAVGQGIVQLNIENKELKNQTKILGNELIQLMFKNTLLGKQVTALELQNTELDKSISELTLENTLLGKQVTGLNLQNSELGKNVVQLTLSNSNMQNQNKLLGENLVKLELQNSQLEAQNKLLQQQIQSLSQVVIKQQLGGK